MRNKQLKLTDRDGGVHPLHVGLLHEDLDRLLAQRLDVALLERLAALELRAGGQQRCVWAGEWQVAAAPMPFHRLARLSSPASHVAIALHRASNSLLPATDVEAAAAPAARS